MIQDYFIQAEKLHDEAMSLVDDAFLAKMQGDKAIAKQLLLEATDKEIQAAGSLPPEEAYEPSRGILYRSAASLAYDAKDYRLADRLVATGLSGFPTADVEKELKDLYDDINFMRHAEAEGIKIAENGFIITVAGQATKHGGSSIDHILKRLSQIQDEFYRTVERLLGLEFRTNKPVDKLIKEKFNLYLDTQFASSFGIHILVGTPQEQLHLFPELKIKGEIEGNTVVNEVIDCLRILESANPERIKEKISDEAYRDDFIGFAKQIAPDGTKIKTVAFRSGGEGASKKLVLRKTKTQLKESILIPQETGAYRTDTFELRGYLRRATSSSSRKFGTIGLDSQESGRVTIKVPIGLMKTTVQPYFEEMVLISGYIKNNTHFLKDIDILET